MSNRALIGGMVAAVGVCASLAQAQIVKDGSFEAGSPSAAWTEFSLVFGTPLCDGSCIDTGESQARTGTWWAWFGGIDSTKEQASLTQSVTIPAGAHKLEFYLVGFTDRTDGQDFLRVFMDATEVFKVTDQGMAPYLTDYTLVSVDVSAFAGGAHVLKFDSETQGGGLLTNFYVDDVSITASSPPPPPVCRANCSGDTDPVTGKAILSIQDFTCFQNAFALGDLSKADVGGTASCTPDGALTISDFSCFQNLFALGCP